MEFHALSIQERGTYLRKLYGWPCVRLFAKQPYPFPHHDNGPVL